MSKVRNFMVTPQKFNSKSPWKFTGTQRKRIVLQPTTNLFSGLLLRNFGGKLDGHYGCIWHLSWGGSQDVSFLLLWLSKKSGQIIIFHQPSFPWNKGISLTKPPFGVRSCEVAIIWPEEISFWNRPQVGVFWIREDIQGLGPAKTLHQWIMQGYFLGPGLY